MQTLHIDLSTSRNSYDNSYDIIIGHGILAQAADYIKGFAQNGRVVIITDPTVAGLYLDDLQAALGKGGLEVSALTCRGGEMAKSFAEYERLAEQLLAQKIERETLLIAFGGGICGDLCGFLAATLLRSLPFVQIPTSLLAQVDSAVGGKTGINTAHGKNLIGAFYQPKLVLSDMALLQKLPVRQLKAGYAEILKYALINDEEFFAWLEDNGAAILDASHPDHRQAIAYAVEVSCRKKAEIVTADEKESGVRALLNLGHTFAHALEACRRQDDDLLHGEAVAIGLDLAFRLSVETGHANAQEAARLQAHLQRLKIAPRLPDYFTELPASVIVEKMHGDKKASQGRVRFILLKAIGQAFISDDTDMAKAEKIIKTYMSEIS